MTSEPNNPIDDADKTPPEGAIDRGVVGHSAQPAIPDAEGLTLVLPPVDAAELPAGEAAAAEQLAAVPPEPATEEMPSGPPVAELPPAELPPAALPPAEPPAAGGPPAAEERAAEPLAAEQPATEQPAVEQQAAERPAAEEPVAEWPVAEELAAEEPAAEKRAAEEPAAEQPAPEPLIAEAPSEAPPPEPKSDKMDWYILKVQSNREDSIREGLRRRVAIAGYDRYFGDIIVPTEKVTEFKAGKRRVFKRKLYPGYLVVQMEINEDTWFLVRETPGIGDFTGAAGHPTPMHTREVAAILAKQEEKADVAPKLKINFSVGDHVKIKEGTFENFEGDVASIDETNGRVTVLINIFGRSTPVDIEYWQIEAV